MAVSKDVADHYDFAALVGSAAVVVVVKDSLHSGQLLREGGQVLPNGVHALCCAPGECTRGHNAVRTVLHEAAVLADPGALHAFALGILSYSLAFKRQEPTKQASRLVVVLPRLRFRDSALHHSVHATRTREASQPTS